MDNGEAGVPVKALYDNNAAEVSCDSPFNPIHCSGYNLVDNGEAGVPVKALYDYDAVEVSCDSPFNTIHFSGYNLVDNGEAGVPVKALYDYDAAEPDELTFKIGNLHRFLRVLYNF